MPRLLQNSHHTIATFRGTHTRQPGCDSIYRRSNVYPASTSTRRICVCVIALCFVPYAHPRHVSLTSLSLPISLSLSICRTLNPLYPLAPRRCSAATRRKDKIQTQSANNAEQKQKNRRNIRFSLRLSHPPLFLVLLYLLPFSTTTTIQSVGKRAPSRIFYFFFSLCFFLLLLHFVLFFVVETETNQFCKQIFVFLLLRKRRDSSSSISSSGKGGDGLAAEQSFSWIQGVIHSLTRSLHMCFLCLIFVQFELISTQQVHIYPILYPSRGYICLEQIFVAYSCGYIRYIPKNIYKY